MVEILVVLAILDWIGGMFALTQATQGVGIIASACLLGIFARMAQSRRQHRELLRAIRAQQAVAATPEAATDLVPAFLRSDDRWTCENCGARTDTQFYDCTRCRAPRS